jgi:hypothetical protein
MKELSVAIKKLAAGNFKNVSIMARDEKSILATLNAPVHESVNMRVFPEVDDVKVKEIDALHDEVTLLWSDLEIKGVMTWREGKTPNNIKTYCLVDFE